MDLHSGVDLAIPPGETKIIPLGFAIEIPPSMEGQIRPRSSLSKDGILIHFGTVDSDYRGEVGAILSNISSSLFRVKKNDRVAQLVLCATKSEYLRLQVVSELSDTKRGDGGFGSTGKK